MRAALSPGRPHRATGQEQAPGLARTWKIGFETRVLSLYNTRIHVSAYRIGREVVFIGTLQLCGS